MNKKINLKSIKLSKREWLMLSTLIIFVVSFVFFKYVLTSQQEELALLEEELNSKQMIMVEQNLKLEKYGQLMAEHQMLSIKTYLSVESFYPEIIQKKMILTLDEWIKSSGLAVANISFSESNSSVLTVAQGRPPESKTLLDTLVDEYKDLVGSKAEDPEAAVTESITEEPEAPVETLAVAMSFRGAYNNFIAFLQAVENENRKILIKNISLSRGDGDTVLGNLSLEFYAVPKMFRQDESYYLWELEDVYGKANPFNAYGMAVSEAKPKIENRYYDFLMTLRPITTDVPTVILGNGYENIPESTIYEDQENTVPVEIIVSENDGKYYYKYSIGDVVYPTTGDGMAFAPVADELNLRVNSSKRNSPDDHSGVILSVRNKTTMDFNIFIMGDDPNDTRIIMGESEGNVLIK